MVLARFLPKDEQFFDLFAEAAGNALAAAQLLADIIESGEDIERKVRRLRELEHQGDEITHRVYQGLNSTFVTPLDRDDIQRLAGGIDDFVDDLEEVGKRFRLYKLNEATAPAKLFARILTEQAQTMAESIPLLGQVGKRSSDLRKAVLELHRAENEADDALNGALAALYDGVTEIPSLIHALRWGELYQLLEDATDKGEDIGNTLEGILLKYA
jgi:uncharacterized protein Yka (UPF0111/DUF47 family)